MIDLFFTDNWSCGDQVAKIMGLERFILDRENGTRKKICRSATTTTHSIYKAIKSKVDRHSAVHDLKIMCMPNGIWSNVNSQSRFTNSGMRIGIMD